MVILNWAIFFLRLNDDSKFAKATVGLLLKVSQIYLQSSNITDSFKLVRRMLSKI